MGVGDVFEHMIDRSFGCVAFSVIAPPSSGSWGLQRIAVCQPTAERLVAFRVRTLLIIRIIMRIGDMQHLEGRRAFLRRYWRFDRRFLDWRKGYLPFMQRIKCVVARIADHEAADLCRTHMHLFQHVDHFPLYRFIFISIFVDFIHVFFLKRPGRENVSLIARIKYNELINKWILLKWELMYGST